MIVITQNVMFDKNRLTCVIIFKHSNMLCDLDRCFSSVDVIILLLSMLQQYAARGGDCMHSRAVLLRFIALVKLINMFSNIFY